MKTCGLAEDLGVSGPSQSLISLWAVCGNIYKVAFLTPKGI